MDKMEDLKLSASSDTLDIVMNSIEEFLTANGWPKDEITQILIAAEEIYVNIVHYAYGGDVGEAVVQMEINEEGLNCRMTFIDEGIPYNPLEKEDPDISLSGQEREVGGLGIFMARMIMDNMEYKYEDGHNVLTMEKRLEGEGD